MQASKQTSKEHNRAHASIAQLGPRQCCTIGPKSGIGRKIGTLENESGRIQPHLGIFGAEIGHVWLRIEIERSLLSAFGAAILARACGHLRDLGPAASGQP